MKKSHPNSVRLKSPLAKKLIEAEDYLLDLEMLNNDVSSAIIKKKKQVPKNETFFARVELYLGNLKKQRKFNRYSADKGKISVFRQFLNDVDIPFQPIQLQGASEIQRPCH